MRTVAGRERAVAVDVTVVLRAAGFATASAATGSAAVSTTIGSAAGGSAAIGAGVTSTGGAGVATTGSTLWANKGVEEKARTAAIAVIAGRIFAFLWVMIRERTADHYGYALST
jgi:hypothetical protein